MAQLQQLLTQQIQDKIFPGAVLGISHQGQRQVFPVGHLRYDQQAVVTTTTIYDVASITKTIPTTLLLLKLIDQGQLQLDDKVIKFIPELRAPEAESLTIKHLLTFTVSFDLWLSRLKDLPAAEILEAIFAAQLLKPLGTEVTFANATSILTTLVLERVTQLHLAELADSELFKPLAMTDTTFFPKSSSVLAPSEIDDWRGREIQGEVHDESAWKLRDKLVVGSAGLFSTAPDLLNCLEMILNSGQYQGQSIFSQTIIEQMLVNQGQLSTNIGLGWERNREWMGSHPGLGKTGFTGCFVFVDKENELAITFMSNHTYPHRPADRTILTRARQSIIEAVYAEVVV